MSLNQYIDHTLLKQNSTLAQIEKLCEEARTYRFASVCVNPTWVKTCAGLLAGSDVKVCTVIGFPLGATSTQAKAFETSIALQDGADEFDMVVNIGALIDRNLALVENDIRAVVAAAQGKTVKVIIEACLLSDEEKVLACKTSVAAGAHFVKTSTGFSTSGATVHDVALMKASVDGKALVKAAGGVRSLEDMQAMIDAGADRIGTSSGVQLVAGEKIKSGY
ncbi:MAG: deoxyribose-phosphate aldolase [Firmicutes bacterium GWF2_51_9]|nr:MAG: deoxyribose-phosphate aldolase [Firmicutes bacterium GWF2_51_9]OGS59124.1 MAG: deoxyribose-phosphate aldolase [Firmicutes bacterium GWE2_51_13]HBZ41227.1 deoxyribose-phosphate aldolase [Erysipelotrichaceae bacterium]